MAKQHGSRRNKSDRKSTGKRGNKLERKSSGKRQKEDKYKLRRRNEIDGDVVLNVLAKQDVAMSLTELITALGNRSSDSKNIRTVLQELTELGMILQPRPGRYALNGSGGEYIAKITVDQDAHKFANFADGSSAPIAQNHDMGVSDGDVVHILLNEKAEALVIRIVERIGQPMVGTLNFQTREVSFTPDNRRKGDLPIVGKKKQIIDSYQSGDRVVGELVQTPTGSFAVELKRILDEQSPEIADFERVRLIHDLPEPFEEHIESAAKAQVISDFTVGDRMDCREDFIFTIDPETAKDFDDAISISRGERGIWKLGVHIADVSHFVEEHGVIDQEAVRRGTSCYLINRVIPMLPEVLSNGMCSLVPDEDRYALSVFIELDKNGKILSCTPSETVIRSRHRLSYEEALAILEKRQKPDTYSEQLVETVRQSNALAQLLRKNRVKNGSLNLFSIERGFVLDVEGNPVDVKQETGDIAHQLIEEFMLLANRAVAAWLDERGCPAVYRVHGSPDEERFNQFLQIVDFYGIDTAGAADNRKGLQQLLKRIDKEPDAARIVLNFLCLRSFQKATYQVQNIGHYALAFDKYLHFTSPIRRYPDLIVHRLVKSELKVARYKNTQRQPEHLDALARQSSYLERRAEMAEREIKSTKGARYLSRKIGEIFSAVVVGASNSGLFVDLLETGLSGMIPIRDLGDDFWELAEGGMGLNGRSTGVQYRIGQEVQVQIVAVDILRAQVNLHIAEDTKEKKNRKDAKSRGSLKISDYL